MKRGEISMEVIIVAALALLVLVILSVLLIMKLRPVGQDCAQIGGFCEDGDFTSCNEGYKYSAGHNCGGGKVCCVPIAPEDEY